MKKLYMWLLKLYQKPAEASFLTDQIRNNKEKEVDVTAVQQELKQVLDIVGDSISPELQEK